MSPRRFVIDPRVRQHYQNIFRNQIVSYDIKSR